MKLNGKASAELREEKKKEDKKKKDIAEKRRIAKKKKEDNSYQMRINASTGEVDFPEDGSGRMLSKAAERGDILQVSYGGQYKYFINPYLYSYMWAVGVKPNDTLLKMFECDNYCRSNCCKHYTDYIGREKFCDECKLRIPVNEDEFMNINFKALPLDSESKVYFEMMEFDDEDEHEYEPYQKYLNSKYWKEFRQKALDHYGHKCCWCGAEEEDTVFNVHHVRYGDRYDEELENVVILCHSCHSKAHGKDW